MISTILIAYWKALPEKGRYLVHVLCITGMIFLLIYMGSFVQLNIKAINPLTRSMVDYEITDIVFSKFKDRSTIDLEQRIIMLNTGKPDRVKIQKAVEKLTSLGVKAIGIDILFDERKDEEIDHRLAQTFQSSPNLVLASVLGEYDPRAKLFSGMTACDPYFCDSVSTGYINFVAKPSTTIRLFSATEETVEKKELAFAVKMAEKVDPALVSDLIADQNPLERINYKGNLESFIQYDIDQVLEENEGLKSVFKDKIVIAGYMGDEEWAQSSRDKFYTPLNENIAVKSLPDMYGVLIHANILAMILDRSYVTEVPEWINRLIEIFVIMLCVAIIRMDYLSFKQGYWIVIRLLQIVIFVLLFYLVAGVLYYFNTRLSLTIGIIGVLMAWDTVDFYENVVLKQVKDYVSKIDGSENIENPETMPS